MVCTARGCGDALARWALYHVRCARFAEAHAYLDDPVEAEDAAKRMRALGLRAAVVRAGDAVSYTHLTLPTKRIV